jgi:hypothetical protein
MRSKSVVVLLAVLAGTALAALLKDTVLAIAIEEATSRVADWLGVPRAQMIAAVTPYVLAFGVASAVAVASYHLGMRDRAQKPAFEFIFDHSQQWVQTDHPQRISYLFGLHVLAPQTVDFPNVWMLKSPLTKRLFDPEHASGGHVLYKGGAIDPDVTEPIQLFDLPPNRKFINLRYEGDPLGSRQTFVLEARCRHYKPVQAKFEYDPDKVPMIRMLP